MDINRHLLQWWSTRLCLLFLTFVVNTGNCAFPNATYGCTLKEHALPLKCDGSFGGDAVHAMGSVNGSEACSMNSKPKIIE